MGRGADRLGPFRFSMFLLLVLAVSACASAPPAPRRVLLVGDSLMLAAAPEISRLLSVEGTETRTVAADGTGPLTPQGQWLNDMSAALDEFHPDIVVIEACCNYGAHQPYRLPDGTTIQPDSHEMYLEWERSLRVLIAATKAAGARPFMVLTPDPDPSGDLGYLAERVRQLNDIYVTLGVPTIDWRPPLFVAGAQSVPVRGPDGLHLTSWGNVFVARATREAIR